MSQISLVDRYIIRQLIPPLIFACAICLIVGELIGISFEQVEFMVNRGLPLTTSIYIHYLKLPAYLSLALPFALLTATLIAYSKLSNYQEIVALQSFGIGILRLLAPAMAIALFLALIMFGFHEFLVPAANYQAAIILEQEFKVDRTKLAKYAKQDLIYPEFSREGTQQQLKTLFFAQKFNGSQMKEVVILRFQEQHLQQIAIAQTAQWNETQQQWQLFNGTQNILDAQGNYQQNYNFQQLFLPLSKNILDYANHHRDAREMNLRQLYRRLAITRNAEDTKTIRDLQISIQERYAAPFSCVVFAWLGSALGIKSRTRARSSSYGLAAVVIFAYYAVQFLSIALTTAKILPIFFGVWLPNLLAISLGYYTLMTSDR